MAGKMKSMSDLSPGCSESEHSEEMTDLDEKEKETPPKKKMKKRRTAGDISGRQMALRRIKQEKKKNVWEAFGAPVSSFEVAARASREVLLQFSEDDEITEEHASAMRVYMNQMFSVSSTVSYDHFFCSPVLAFLPKI